ncbi:MAG: DUF4097 family beta strand repeat-containing protein [Candidatus Poribacteria bacterium]
MNKARETILRLLSEGKITIEEAEELLDAMTTERVGHVNRDPFANAGRAFQEQNKPKHDMQFDFNFPWDDPDWKWPWEEEGWHWPWEPSAENEGSESKSTFYVEENSILIIESSDGNLSIQLADDDGLVYVNSDDEEIESVLSEDKMTRIITLGDTNANIIIPRRISSVQISKNDGDISISDLQSDIELKSDDGNIAFSGINGNIRVSMNDGSLMINDVNSDEIAIKSDDGNIILNNIISKNVAVKMNDGMVSMDMANVITEGTFVIAIDDGRISLSLPSGSNCEIIANVDGGVIRHNLEQEGLQLSSIEIKENNDDNGECSLVATLNGGGAKFALSLDTGEINIQVQ